MERVPVAELVDPRHRYRVRHPSGYVGPGFDARGMLVWGFTAGLLDRVFDLAGWTRPWDRGRVRDLPPSAAARDGRVPPPADRPAAGPVD